MKGINLSSIGCIIAILLMSSCVNTRKTTYFNDVNDETLISPSELVPVIHKSDILSISVSSLNPDASKLFNELNTAQNTTANPNGSSSQSVGYLVNEDGNFNFPVLGSVKAEGLTVKQLNDYLTSSLINKKLLVEPIVTVRFLNFRVTILGEVGHPTVVNVPNERISILEALGLAGDITIYGKRDNVLLIREDHGQKIIKRINLNSQEVLTSPFYYLRSNDVVYVEANKDKIRSASNGRQLLPLAFSALAFLTTVAFLIAYHNN
jgi:polysaccharide biosynthesis/export protein